MIHTTQEEFPKGKAVAIDQVRSHYNVIQGRLIGFTTEDEPA
jgi:hypothetical protein